MGDTRSEAARRQDERWLRYVRDLQAGARRPFPEQLAFYRETFADRAAADGPPEAWGPDPQAARRSHLGQWMHRDGHADYQALHRSTVEDRAGFWSAVLQELGVAFSRPPRETLAGSDPLHPTWLPGAEMNIVDSCFGASPEAPAVLTGREGGGELRTTTYAELHAMVRRVSAGLGALGFREGDAIALYLPMTLECVAAYLGVLHAGCVAVSIADSFPPDELARRIDIAGARAVVTVDVQRRAGKTLPMLDKVRAAAAPRAIVIPDGSARPPLREGDVLWEELLSHGEATSSSPGPGDRTANVLFSSGTTGTPKAIPWTHLTPVKGAMDACYHQDVHEGDVVCWPTNIGWMMGPWLIFGALVNRATIALFEGAPTGGEFTSFVGRAGVTMLGVVPSLVRAWRAGGAMDGKRWKDVRVFSSTGEPSAREDYLWLMSRADYRAPVIEYLGGTEIGGGHITGTVVQPASPSTFTTPALGIDFVLRTEEGGWAEVGHSGELYLIPPAIGLSQRLLNADHDRVYHAGCPEGPGGEALRRHGDRFVRLPRGFYRAEGRVDDTMNLGGIKVGSLELERVLGAHPGVAECAAIGAPPPDGGAERLVLYVVPEGPLAEEELKRELNRDLAAHLNPLFRIHEVVLAESLPRTASNKLMRRKLLERYRTRTAPHTN